jgi:hypothetical protein
VRWMYLVSQERNTEIPSSELTQLWLVALKSYPLEAINHGFMEALREVTYPIKLSDVATRAQVWMELQEGKQVRHVEPHVKPCDCDFTKVERILPTRIRDGTGCAEASSIDGTRSRSRAESLRDPRLRRTQTDSGRASEESSGDRVMKISQREARRLRKENAQLRFEMNAQLSKWSSTWPSSTSIGSVQLADDSKMYGRIEATRMLNHAVVVIAEGNGRIVFFACELPRK